MTYYERDSGYKLLKYTSNFREGTRSAFLITPLLAACFLDRPEHAKLLVERGADVNMRVKNSASIEGHGVAPDVLKLTILELTQMSQPMSLKSMA